MMYICLLEIAKRFRQQTTTIMLRDRQTRSAPFGRVPSGFFVILLLCEIAKRFHTTTISSPKRE